MTGGADIEVDLVGGKRCGERGGSDEEGEQDEKALHGFRGLFAGKQPLDIAGEIDLGVAVV